MLGNSTVCSRRDFYYKFCYSTASCCVVGILGPGQMPTTSETRSRGFGASRPHEVDTDASEIEAIDARPKRRLRKPSAKAQQSEANRGAIDAALLSSDDQNGAAEQITVIHDVQTRKKGRRGGDEQTTVITMQDQMEEQTSILKNLLEAWMKQEAHNKTLEAEVGLIKQELQAVKEECQAVKDELHAAKEQLDNITAVTTGQGSPHRSYAEVARTPPNSVPANVHSISSMGTTPSTMTDTLYCTVDTSRVASEYADKVSAGAIRANVEKEMRDITERINWRCRAVTLDRKNPNRVRIACRDEAEHKEVKQAIETNLVEGARVLQDDLYPVRVDSVNRVAVLDETGNIRTGAAEAFGQENDTQVAKIAWLSNREVAKAYGSMVVYLSKASDARRLLQEGFFYAGGESGYTKPFERRERPKQCFNCQEVTSHRAYQCTKPRVCGKCAKEGHHHNDCIESIAKCVPCGGPHESFSRNCRKLYPTHE